MIRVRLPQKKKELEVHAGTLLIDKGFDVTFKAENFEDLISNDIKQVIVIGAADIGSQFVISEDPARAPFSEEKIAHQCSELHKILSKKGVRMFFIGIKTEYTHTIPALRDEMKARIDKVVKEIEKRWV